MNIGLLGTWQNEPEMDQDDFIAGQSSSIMIVSSKRNKYVTGLLLDNIEISMDGVWKSPESGNKVIKKLTDIASVGDTATQAIFGSTIRQPWSNRQLYSGATPVEIRTRFIIYNTPKNNKQNGAKTVSRQAENVFSMMLPRKKVDTGEALESKVDSNTLNMKSAMDVYEIPGPSLLFGLGKNREGDFISVQIGTYLRWGVAYMTSCQVEFSRFVTDEGEPLYAIVTANIRTIDSAYVDNAGNATLLNSEYSSMSSPILEQATSEVKEAFLSSFKNSEEPKLIISPTSTNSLDPTTNVIQQAIQSGNIRPRP
jgi:hypothetical protein